ncbi:unnamed protein product [Ilex paraguariensis]|uniref:RRM domain-containing protein n=1 Tax=Ilex paraguariensis TaxID=185542 RepID=A0ABC8QUP3_9AQUA
MPQTNKSTKPSYNSKDSDESGTPSNNLWVGNLSTDVTDSDLMNLFAKHGAMDSITTYSSRSYAFVYFKRIQDAKSAKEALQGMVLKGNAIKIEFAKPILLKSEFLITTNEHGIKAKPSKSLWVGGIGPSVSKEELEEAFLKFGKLQEFKFLRDRNTAFVEYFRLEDASQALKSINGKQIGGDQIRVDFLRSQPSRREHWSDLRDSREGLFLSRSMGPPDSPWMPQDFMGNYHEPTHAGSKRQQHSQSSGGRKVDGQPSKVLWISYPPSVHIDEQMLHNAMILFGEIERIRCVDSRHYSLVEFRSVDEARLAKEGLQGKLFNDPRISIEFSSNDPVPNNDFPGFYPAIKGPGLDMFSNELPFLPAQMDVYGNKRPMVTNSFPGPLPPRGIHGPDVLMRPLGPQGSFEPLLPGPEFSDVATLDKFPGNNPHTVMSGLNWRSSPAPGILSFHPAGMRPPIRNSSGGWDVFDANQLLRESKRSRIDSTLAFEASIPLRKIDDRGLGLDQLYGLAPQGNGGASAPLANFKGKNRLSPVDARVTAAGTGQGHPDHDFVWRGVIAKGGTPVCRARCVPIGEGIESEIPEVVNCSARTGLDMLTKHYADAVGFSIVFFLPDSEEDFASYTEFLRYLGTKDRAGVAKFDDGTTLFLVPPSDFLTKILNVAGPERLYGVVLKFPEHAPSGKSEQPQSLQPHYVSRQNIPSSQTQYTAIPQEERVLQEDYNRVAHEDSKPLPKLLGSLTSDSMNDVHSVPPISSTAVSQAGVTLTPELIATLASLLPTSGKFSVSESARPTVGSLTSGPLLTPTAMPDKGVPHEWTHNRQAPEQPVHSVQQLGSQFNPQEQVLSQLQAFPTASNAPNHYAQGVIGRPEIQYQTFNLPQQGAVSSKPSVSFAIPSQSGQFALSSQVDQQYQQVMPQETQKSNGMGHGTDAYSIYDSSVVQQPSNSVTSTNVIRGANVSQQHTAMPLASEKVNLELTNQVHQLQSTLYGAGQGTSEVDADKNERYRSTLQFAANLLFQIQQQQQPGAQARQGSGNQ